MALERDVASCCNVTVCVGAREVFAYKVIHLPVMGAAMPSAGTLHTLMVVSSEPVAMTLGEKGLKSMSST